MDKNIYYEKLKWYNMDYNNSFDKLYYNNYNGQEQNSKKKKTSKERQGEKKEKNKNT